MKEEIPVGRYLRTYIEQLSPSPSGETARHKTQMIRNVLSHLASSGVADLRGIDLNAAYAYVGLLGYVPQNRSGFEFQLCEVLDLFCGQRLVDFEGRTLFPLI